jgi:hypothetical protein
MRPVKAISDPKKLLLAVAKFFEKYPERWAKGNYATAKDGTEVYTTDPAACCFCVSGALARFNGTRRGPESVWAAKNGYRDALAALQHQINGVTFYDVYEWNDKRKGPAAVVKACRAAAATL